MVYSASHVNTNLCNLFLQGCPDAAQTLDDVVDGSHPAVNLRIEVGYLCLNAGYTPVYHTNYEHVMLREVAFDDKRYLLLCALQIPVGTHPRKFLGSVPSAITASITAVHILPRMLLNTLESFRLASSKMRIIRLCSDAYCCTSLRR